MEMDTKSILTEALHSRPAERLQLIELLTKSLNKPDEKIEKKTRIVIDMGDTIVISNKMTNSIILGFSPFEEKELEYKLEDDDKTSYYIEFIPNLNIITPIAREEMLSESYLTMLASQDVLKRVWDNPDEDKAWEHL